MIVLNGRRPQLLKKILVNFLQCPREAHIDKLQKNVISISEPMMCKACATAVKGLP